MSQLIFNKYEIIRRLALGGMGEVFLARERSQILDRLVILKSLLPELAEQEGFVEQFLDEARVAATLNHPNIVSIYEVGQWNGVYFIAMEHILGGDLSKLQRAASKEQLGVPYQVSARIILDACLGLHHAHTAVGVDGSRLNVVHRDISPQNIMVRSDGVTKVVDFGIAMASNRETRTATGLLKGKLQYMPPEQVRGDKLDGRSDQFSLGVVLWEMCTGRRLFKAANELETLKKVLNSPIPRPSSIVSGFSEHLDGIIMKMLSREAKDRYPDCAQAADALKGYLDSCTRQIGQQQVAVFVKKAMGDELNARTRNVEPSGDNFMIPLGENSGPNLSPSYEQPTPTANYTAIYQRNRRNTIAAVMGLGIVLAAVMGLALGWDLIFGASEADTSVGLPPPPGLALPTPPQPVPQARVVVAKPGKRLGSVAFHIAGPAGAQVIVDGKAWKEPAPTVLEDLKPGPHKIEIVVDGKTVNAEDINVEAGSQPAVLKITSKPRGAMVWLEGTPLGKTPLSTKRLPPGVQLSLQVSKKGYRSTTLDLTLKASETMDKHVDLARRGRTVAVAPTPKPRPPKTIVETKIVKAASDGYLTINTTPWSKVSIDGQPYGSTPIFKVRLSPGRHTVVLENENLGVKLTKKVTVTSGDTLRRHWKLGK